MSAYSANLYQCRQIVMAVPSRGRCPNCLVAISCNTLRWVWLLSAAPHCIEFQPFGLQATGASIPLIVESCVKAIEKDGVSMALTFAL